MTKKLFIPNMNQLFLGINALSSENIFLVTSLAFGCEPACMTFLYLFSTILSSADVRVQLILAPQGGKQQ